MKLLLSALSALALLPRDVRAFVLPRVHQPPTSRLQHDASVVQEDMLLEQQQQQQQHAAPLSAPPLIKSTDELLVVEEQTSLVFKCSSIFHSDPIPMATPREIQEFFSDPKQLNCMVSAGNQSPIEHVTAVDSTLRQDWKDACQLVGATKWGADSSLAESVIRVSTSAMNFPGLALTSNAFIGSRLLESIDNDDGDADGTTLNGYPSYEFVLIRDEQTAKGFAPAVWLFNKLTGSQSATTSSSKKKAKKDVLNGNGGKRRKTSPRTLSHVSVVPSNTLDDELCFQFKVNFEIKLSFPKVLLKILPMSKVKAEQEGSSAIQKTLNKDLTKVMVVLRDQYMEQHHIMVL
jgi:hypothetical protein